MLLQQLLFEDGSLILEISPAEVAPEPMVRWLLDEASRVDGLQLVFSVQDGAARFFQLTGLENAKRIFLSRLGQEQVRAVIDRQFQPNHFPAGLYRSIQLYSQGLPGYMAGCVYRLLQGNGIIEDENGNWSLPEGGLSAPQVEEVFARELSEQIERSISQATTKYQKPLRDFLLLSAICGQYVPVVETLQVLDFSRDEIDEIVDCIDDAFGDGGQCPIFEDLGYKYHAYSRRLTYRQLLDMCPAIICARNSQVETQRLARELLRVLKRTVPLETRATAKLFLRVSTLAGQPDSDFYASYLAWWIDIDEMEELEKLVLSDLDTGRLNPEVLWNIIVLSKRSWPEHLRLALMNVYGSNYTSLPDQRAPMFHALRASALDHLGQEDEAIEEARKALSLGGGEKSASSFLAYQVLCSVAVAKHDVELHHESCSKQLELARAIEPGGGLEAFALSSIAVLLIQQGRYKEAEAASREGYEIYLSLVGPDDQATCEAALHLSRSLICQDRKSEAHEYALLAQKGYEKIFHWKHASMGVLYSVLGETTAAIGDLKSAAEIFQKAYLIYHSTMGPDHHDTKSVVINARSYGIKLKLDSGNAEDTDNT
ncbi:tetratricopeptide repeat protein [Desulfobacterota bacterium AH_259_B03_O07]|nr:tetratricopeptide repeat protein [Desulfobacterota bacterium AH_259_B03_O07]